MNNKEILFKAYSIDETHNVWSHIDSHGLVSIFRLMNDGNLPTDKDVSMKYILNFLDKVDKDIKFVSELMQNGRFGNFYLTAKRAVYRFQEQLLDELNKPISTTEA